MRKTLNSPLISSNCHTMPFFEAPPPLVLPSSIYLPLPNLSSSTPPLLPLPQLHLRSISLFFFPSFHATAAIFSPYLEPAILSLSTILRRTPGSVHEAPFLHLHLPAHHPLTSNTFEHWHEKVSSLIYSALCSTAVGVCALYISPFCKYTVSIKSVGP